MKEISFRESVSQKLGDNIDSCVKMLKSSENRYGTNMSSPQIVQKPRNSKLLEESDGLFQTKIVGNPTPTITWFKDGYKIHNGDKYEIEFRNSLATLRIHNLSHSDTGHYTILAENIQGCVVASAYLAVESNRMQDDYLLQESSTSTTSMMYLDNGTNQGVPPKFLDVPKNKEVTEGI